MIGAVSRRRLLRGGLALSAYLGCLALWLSYARHGFNPWDECVLAYGGLRVQQGQMVWIDFFGYAPGRYLLAALFYWLFGTSLYSLRLGFNLMTAVMPLLSYSLARRLMPARFAWIPAGLVVLGPAVYYFRPYPFVALLGAWSLCRLAEAPSTRRQLAHGAVLFVCMMLETAGGGFVVLLTPVALWISAGPWIGSRGNLLRALGRILAAAMVAALPLLAAYVAHGKLLEAAGLQAYRYIVASTSIWVDYPNPLPSLMSGNWQELMQQGYFWVMALCLAAAVVLAAVETARGRERYASLGVSHAAEAQFLLLGLLGVMNFLLPLYRAGFYNVLRASPLPWILGMFLAARLWEAGATVSRPALLVRRWASGALLLLPVALVVHLTTDEEYRNLSTGGPPGAALRRDLEPLDDPRAGIDVEHRHAELLRGVLGWIRRDSREGDALFAVPLNPMFYFFGRRDNPTPNDYILPGYWKDQSQIQAALQQLARRPPKLFEYCDVPVDGLAERRFRVYSAPIYDWFLRRYAWTDRLDYALAEGNTVPFYHYRRLRPDGWWPQGLEAASHALVPTRFAGPVSFGPTGMDGRQVWAWHLHPGSITELEVSGAGRHVLLMRPECLGTGQPGTRPVLKVTVRGGPQRPPEVHWFLPEPGTPDRQTQPEDDGPLVPMTAVALVPDPGETLRVRLEPVAWSMEQLGGEVLLVQPAVLSDAAVFYRPDEPVPPEAP